MSDLENRDVGAAAEQSGSVGRKQSIKSGTLIETFGCLGVKPERAIIQRWRKVNDDGSGPNHIRGNGGWHVVRFVADGGTLMMHESNFRMIDNRGA